MEILFLTKYSRLGSSSRYRALQFFPHLEADGWTVSWQHFLSDRYVRQFYQGRGRSKMEGGKAILRRAWYLFRTNLKRFDVIHLQAEALPRIPFFLECLLLQNRDRLVLDYDDAVFEPYQKSLFMRQKIARLVNSCAHVIVANDYLRSYLSRYTSNISLLPTVIDISRYQVKESHQWKPGHRIVIGWIGSPATTTLPGVVFQSIADSVRPASHPAEMCRRTTGFSGSRSSRRAFALERRHRNSNSTNVRHRYHATGR